MYYYNKCELNLILHEKWGFGEKTNQATFVLLMRSIDHRTYLQTMQM